MLQNIKDWKTTLLGIAFGVWQAGPPLVNGTFDIDILLKTIVSIAMGALLTTGVKKGV